MHKALSVIFAGLVMMKPAVAQPIPGADEPAVRSAALRWLNNENPREDLWNVGEFAADGNTAARLLVNQIEARFMSTDFPELNASELRALLPQDRHTLASAEQPYFVDETVIPALVAQQAMQTTPVPDVWVSNAEVVLSAGLNDAFAQELYIALDREDVFVEVLEFADDIIPVETYLRSKMWHVEVLVQIFTPYWERTVPERSEELRLRWSQSFDRERFVSEFQQAIEDQRWGALDVLGVVLSLDPPFAQKFDVSDVNLRLASIIAVGGSPELRRSPPSSAELVAIGEVVVRDSARSPHLVPFVRACEVYCQEDVIYCVATTMLLAGPRSYKVNSMLAPPGLEPLISEAEFYSSNRAVHETIGVINAVHKSDWLSLPQCIISPE